MNANFSRASEKPGRGWYLEPAFATTVKEVVAPGRSLLANFTPASPVSYWKDPDAAAARPLLEGAADRRVCREARRARDPSTAGEAIARDTV